jgi:hypothetical protein
MIGKAATFAQEVEEAINGLFGKKAITEAALTNILPAKLYHYTAYDTEIIMKEGLIGKSGTNYATPIGDLSPTQALLENAMNPKNGLPIHILEIDVAKCQSLGIEISGPFRVTGMVNNMPGGGWEYRLPSYVPPSALKVLVR